MERDGREEAAFRQMVFGQCGWWWSDERGGSGRAEGGIVGAARLISLLSHLHKEDVNN